LRTRRIRLKEIFKSFGQLEVLVLIRSLASILFVVSSFVFVTGQAPDAKKGDADNSVKTATGVQVETPRDMPFPGGVNLQFLIKKLARDIGLNVIFDPESKLDYRQVKIELKNVTTAAAIDYILLQEGLISEKVGPGTILVSSRARAQSINKVGINTVPLTDQLAEYFGVPGGLLISYVHDDSPGAKVGLKAGDVIVGIDGEAVRGAVGLIRAIDDKKDNEFALRIVRDHKSETVKLRVDSTSP
jgi:membrane-associated protease RseP (regulator of RpoE activity)